MGLVRLWKRGYKDLRLNFFSEECAMAGSVQAMVRSAEAREVMDIRQASEYLGISGDSLYRYASEGFIPAFKLGSRWRFKKSLVDAWMVEKSGGKGSGAVVEITGRTKKPAGRAR